MARKDLKIAIVGGGLAGLAAAMRIAEAEIEHVERNEEKQNYTGDSLDQVEPISRIRIG